MKKLLTIAAVAGLLISPAMAAMTLEFKRDTGEVNVITLNDDGTATLPDGSVVPFTYDAENEILCADTGAAEQLCIDIDSDGTPPEVGSTARYKTNDGKEGTVTVISISAPS